MNICRLPLVLGSVVTLVGSLCAAYGDWGVAAIYGVCFLAIVVYSAGIYWVEDRPRLKQAKFEGRR